MKEIWKPVVGYEGSYEVSSLGRVRSLDRNIIGKNNVSLFFKGVLKKQRQNAFGYLCVVLCKKGKHSNMFTHRVVAYAFLDDQMPNKEINHKDGVKTNNRLENLEWVTRSENIIHAYKMGLYPREKPHQWKPIDQFTIDGDFIQNYRSIKIASAKTGVCKVGIACNARQVQKSAGGFVWKYSTKKKE